MCTPWDTTTRVDTEDELPEAGFVIPSYSSCVGTRQCSEELLGVPTLEPLAWDLVILNGGQGLIV